jgi:hypothetical protein
MAGGGFMKHASDTNRQDKNQKLKRRANYEKNHPDKSILNNQREKIEFIHLTDEQINIERERIRIHFESIKRRNQKMILVIGLIFVVLGLYIIFKISFVDKL